MRESPYCTSDERMNEATDETLLMYGTGKERPCKKSSMLIFAVFSQVLETWATYDPGDEETQAKSSKQCQATSTIVQVTSLRLLGEVVTCHKAKFTAMGLNYLTS
ncbi:hypothetical protein NC652_018084 [Populus alba x Populus x berolinensis]|nr:hypothetical protein NC652_018084 [Populus alba x Populus x berolinensis]